MNAQSTLVDCTLFMTTDSRMYDGLSISSMHTDAVVGAGGGQALGPVSTVFGGWKWLQPWKWALSQEMHTLDWRKRSASFSGCFHPIKPGGFSHNTLFTPASFTLSTVHFDQKNQEKLVWKQMWTLKYFRQHLNKCVTFHGLYKWSLHPWVQRPLGNRIMSQQLHEVTSIILIVFMTTSVWPWNELTVSRSNPR